MGVLGQHGGKRGRRQGKTAPGQPVTQPATWHVRAGSKAFLQKSPAGPRRPAATAPPARRARSRCDVVRAGEPALHPGRCGARTPRSDQVIQRVASHPTVSPSPSAARPVPSVQRNVPGHAVQPARELFPPRDRRRFPGQDEKCRLKGIIGLVAVPQHTTADTQDHHTMPFDQRREGRLRGSDRGWRQTARAARHRSSARPPRTGTAYSGVWTSLATTHRP